MNGAESGCNERAANSRRAAEDYSAVHARADSAGPVVYD